MFFEEEELPRTKAVLKPRKLDGVSADDLREYLEFLATEQVRAETALAAKSGMSQEAEALFRK